MQFNEKILVWYDKNKRDLPWRSTKDPYRIWLSEIILQQTQVAQGLPYYERFTTSFPTVVELALANGEEVLKLWQGLGYYSRARNLHETAKKVAFELNGIFPENHADLKLLKGVGDYTASAIASICYNEKVAVVDGNVIRVLSRFFGMETAIGDTAYQKIYKERAQEVMHHSRYGDYNQAIMEFGALQCKPQNPDCKGCMLNDNCVAYNLGKVDELPRKIKKVKIKKRYFHFLVVQDPKGNTLMEERKGKDVWNGLYQFPLMETDSLGRPSKLKSCIEETYNIKVSRIRLLESAKNAYKLTHQHIFSSFWKVETPTTLTNGTKPNEWSQKPLPSLIVKFMERHKF